MTPSRTTARVTVWDPAVRVVHWSLVVAFAICYVTQEQRYSLHVDSGYVVLALVAFRILWGVVGPRHARFARFVVGPISVARHLRDIARGRPGRHLGHSPAGAAMTVVLLLTLLVITLSGIALDAAENRAGPLAAYRFYYYTDLIEGVHEIASHACLALVVLHVVGVVVACWQHRENLVQAMITGRKRIAEE